MRKFYSHIITIESLIVELDNMSLSSEEKIHLANLIDINLHNTILDAILSEMQEEDKKIFLEALSINDHDKIWQHLNTKVENIEEKIKKAADDLKSEMQKDIKEAQKIKITSSK